MLIDYNKLIDKANNYNRLHNVFSSDIITNIVNQIEEEQVKSYSTHSLITYLIYIAMDYVLDLKYKIYTSTSTLCTDEDKLELEKQVLLEYRYEVVKNSLATYNISLDRLYNLFQLNTIEV